MTAWEQASRRADRLYAYAFQLYDQDTRVGRSLQMQQEMSQVYSNFQSTTSFMRPEILALGREQIDKYLAAEPKLGQYRMFFDDILRAAPHTLTPAEEKMFARMAALGEAGGTLQSVFRSADLPFPEVTLLDRREGPARRVGVHEVARLAEQGRPRPRVQGVLDGLQPVHAHVRDHAECPRAVARQSKDVRNFATSLEAALFDYNIPRDVYSHLLDDVHANLPTLHRYLKLRQKIMGVRAAGLRGPLRADRAAGGPAVHARAGHADDARCVRAARHRVRRDPAQGLRRPLGRLHAHTGKSPGAYSNTVYGVHPYQLLNFNGAWDDVSTLAHESGHSMHSYLSSAQQPYATASYSTFVAEVASTLNENLLLHHVLDQTQDDRTRLFLLSSYLDSMRTTLFRQTLFAEFELKIHEHGRARRAADRRCAQQALPRAVAPVLRARRGRRAGRRAVRRGVGVHPALLSQLLRLPVRDQHDRRHVAGGRHDRQATP